MNGKLIVIDGIDGSGKATQARLLVERLQKEGRAVRQIGFPRYGEGVFGELLGECLSGKHGDFVHLDPKIASMLYALDRFEAAPDIRAWLTEGEIVVADRYASANQIHQGGKFVDEAKRADFLSWAESVEYGVLSIPRPDATIYLRVPVEVSVALLAKERAAKNAAAGAVDVVEKDAMYLERSYESAEALAGSEAWITIECAPSGAIRSREDIHEEVYKAAVGLL